MPSLSKVGSEMLDGALPAISGASLTNLDARDLENALPAISGASLTGIDGGDKRNFIIDGDFTQWPEGTSQTSLANGQYGPALWRWWGAGAQAVSDVQRSTDVPTVAQSGHQSAYSLQIDCTTAEAAVAAGEWAHIDYHVTGSDFAHLHQQEVTLNFWHKHTKTGTFCVAFRNSAQNRSYIAEYTQTTTNTWEEATITLTLDTGGTWLFTEYDIGLTIFFTLYTGSTYQAAANTWHAGDYAGTSNQVNGLDNTANEFLLSQVSLTLGSSAPTFTSLPLATVKDQVGYYVEELLEHQGAGGATARMMGSGFFNDTDSFWTSIHYTSKKRKVPVITYGSTMTHYSVTWENNANYAEAFNQVTHISKVACAIHAELDNTGATHGGYGALLHAINTATFFLVDARH